MLVILAVIFFSHSERWPAGLGIEHETAQELTSAFSRNCLALMAKEVIQPGIPTSGKTEEKVDSYRGSIFTKGGLVGSRE